MRVLITGAGGFVGPYVHAALRKVCGDIAIVATSKDDGSHPLIGRTETLDVTDKAAVAEAIGRHRPTHVINLAGIAAPAVAQADPEAAWRLHLNGALNLADAILGVAPECWLIQVGSGLAYGESAKAGLPLDETALLAPTDDYGASKAAADLALGAVCRKGLKCVRMRPFNHTGAGQAEDYVVPAFAMQVARIEAGLAPPGIGTGNLDAERDFLGVRDVAKAYALVVARSAALEPNAIFNIASGIPRRVGDILDQLLARSTVRITVERDAQRFRANDLPRVVGDASLARARLGWVPENDFEDTLSAGADDWRARVSG